MPWTRTTWAAAGRPPRVALVALALALAAGAGCSGPAPGARSGTALASTTSAPTTTGPLASMTASTTTTPSTASTLSSTPAATDPPPAADVVISLRVERHTADAATAGFEDAAKATLTDTRGWTRAGFRFVFDAPDAPYRLVLAEGPEVDALCRPYDTHRTYSCQLGPVVALNADRWRSATPQWTGDLATYRQMLVDHEVGHLLGLKHPSPQCPQPGVPARVMAQQSTELHGCLPNPWPLDDEIAIAARHDLPLAPPYER